jgi:hypothetical protein
MYIIFDSEPCFLPKSMGVFPKAGDVLRLTTTGRQQELPNQRLPVQCQPHYLP